MRIVVRIGGSVVASPINTDLMGKYADIIKIIKQHGHEVAVVLGGGALAREFIGIAKKLDLDMTAQDEIAISCSRLFAQLFLKTINESGCNKITITLDDAAQCLSEGKVVVMGGLKPGITTDTVAALVAERVEADLLVKGTDQDGVYDKEMLRTVVTQWEKYNGDIGKDATLEDVLINIAKFAPESIPDNPRVKEIIGQYQGSCSLVYPGRRYPQCRSLLRESRNVW